MTNQEAAEMIRNDMKLHHDYLSGEYRKALKMAISALQEQELKQEVKNSNESSPTHKTLDTISRQAVYDALDNIKIPRNASWYPYYQQALTAVSELPSAQPERKKGRWIVIEKGCKLTSYKCSECGRYIANDTGYDVKKDYPFCHCGAEMTEDSE